MKDYIEKRGKLMAEAKAALDGSDLALAKEKREAIEALDAEKEKYDREAAGLNALMAMEAKAPLRVEDKSVAAPELTAAAPAAKMDVSAKEREVEAFKAFLIGQP